MSLLIRFILNALALWVTTLLYSGISFGPGTGLLSVLWAGIAQIFAGSELQGVDEDADHHPGALPQGSADQAGVALVQGPHGRN